MTILQPLAQIQVPAFIDVEASSLGTRGYPIEVGLITSEGSMYCSLISPPADWTKNDAVAWDDGAERVHGITRPILATHGKPLEDVARELNRIAAGLTLFSDAWGNDYPWLARLFDAADLPMRFQLDSLRKLLDDNEAGRWATVKTEVIAELKLTRHRASSDAKILQRTLMRIKAG
ncbi:MAG TPA: hypothetical protein VH105_21810 [Burkholderiales bacterium]|jgi:hypothetical protein|nr:hypothetical protein [Burkholderiales bacterium]